MIVFNIKIILIIYVFLINKEIITVSSFDNDILIDCNENDNNLSKSALEIENSLRVAFIFAGSPRSFIYPIVYESLRRNLIDSFCPSSLSKLKLKCSRDIFLKISLNDNIHIGLRDANGKFLSKTSDEEIIEKKFIQRALNRLNSKNNEEGICKYTYFKIGSKEEDYEMKNAFFAKNSSKLNINHKIFRNLDKRRYSMYFHRWSAYDMAFQQEIKCNNNNNNNNNKYDWFIHVRMDSLWGHPVPSIFEFMKNENKKNIKKMWVIDSWYQEVPDTMAFLPKEYAKYFFDMDSLVVKGSMCLGGPNFDSNTLTLKYLNDKYNWNENSIEYKIVQENDCFNVQPHDIKSYDKKKNMYWSQAGGSEKILKRKLSLNNISYGKNTLGYIPLTMAIVRRPFQTICFYLDPFFLIGWIRKSQKSSVTITIGCKHLTNELHSVNNIHGLLLDEPFKTDYINKKYELPPLSFSVHNNNNNITSSNANTNTKMKTSSYCIIGADYFAGIGDISCSSENIPFSILPFRLQAFVSKHNINSNLKFYNETTNTNNLKKLKTQNYCMTATQNQNDNNINMNIVTIDMKTCIDNSEMKDSSSDGLLYMWYHATQLFSFYPLRTQAQPIRYLLPNSIGTSTAIASSSTSSSASNNRLLKDKNKNIKLESHMCLTVTDSILQNSKFSFREDSTGWSVRFEPCNNIVAGRYASLYQNNKKDLKTNKKMKLSVSQLFFITPHGKATTSTTTSITTSNSNNKRKRNLLDGSGLIVVEWAGDRNLCVQLPSSSSSSVPLVVSCNNRKDKIASAMLAERTYPGGPYHENFPERKP